MRFLIPFVLLGLFACGTEEDSNPPEPTVPPECIVENAEYFIFVLPHYCPNQETEK